MVTERNRKVSEAAVPPLTVARLMEQVLDLRYFVAEDGQPPPIPLTYVPGALPLVVVVGPNAGGKSFFRRVIAALCQKAKAELLAPSMEHRSQGGMARAFVYGDESWESTGDISSHAILGGIRTAQGRSAPHVVFWDEPDIGLSDGYAAGAGEAIAAFAGALPAATRGVFVVSHRRRLLRPLAALAPHYVHLGAEEAPPSLAAWLAAEEPTLPLDGLRAHAIERFQRIRAVMESK